RGLERGLEQGLEQGLERQVANQAKTLLTMLATKNIAVDDASRDRINACTDTDQLSTWTVRAVTASSIEEILR
ncbi:hypothetical protein, partial [Gordonia sp. (in: high G+C Gram-positive bacteria)]